MLTSSVTLEWPQVDFMCSREKELSAVHDIKRYFLHRGQTSEHAREIARGSHRSIRKTLHVAVTTGASSCELEAEFSFYFNEVHRR